MFKGWIGRIKNVCHEYLSVTSPSSILLHIYMRQIYVLSLPVAYIHCDEGCKTCSAVGSAASCISIGGLQSQIWMTAKIAELQRSVKVHREKSGTFSQKLSAKLSILPQDATQLQPLQCPLGCLEVFNFSPWIPYFHFCSCEQKYKRGDSLSHEWGIYSCVRARQKSVTCSKTQSQPRKTKCAPKVRRESVWLFPTASIFQTHQAVNLLYLKSIYIFSFLAPTRSSGSSSVCPSVCPCHLSPLLRRQNTENCLG